MVNKKVYIELWLGNNNLTKKMKVDPDVLWTVKHFLF